MKTPQMPFARAWAASVFLAAAVVSGPATAASTAPDIAVTLGGPAELQLGRPDHYWLTVTNIGSLAASSVTATMTFPAGVELDTRLNTATGRQDLKIPKNCSYTALPAKKLTCLANNVLVGEARSFMIDLKIPKNCSYTAVPAKKLTCLANNVLVGEVRSFMIDLRAPVTGPSLGVFTWTAAVPGDQHRTNNTATHVTRFDSFNPVANLSFPTSMAMWVAMGRKSVLDNPMTGNPYIMNVDANGDGAGSMGVPVTWHATVVGSGLNIKINSAMYQPAVDINLTPFSSRCFQGMGYWTGLQDSYEVRVCF